MDLALWQDILSDGPTGCAGSPSALLTFLPLFTVWQFFNGGNPFSPEEGVMISMAAIVFIMGLNLVTVKLFGELEFRFALIKIIAYCGADWCRLVDDLYRLYVNDR